MMDARWVGVTLNMLTVQVCRVECLALSPDVSLSWPVLEVLVSVVTYWGH